MGFKLNINNILRSDDYGELEVGKEYDFEKGSLSLLADDIQIWLTKTDWTPLANIQVVSQTRAGDKTIGKFVVKYVYSGAEQKTLKEVFKRMYGWE